MDKLKTIFQKLELSEDVLNELVKEVQTLVEISVKDQVEKEKEKIQEELNKQNEEWKNSEIGKLEEKFEEYKESIVKKFSDFVDHVITEEIEIPEQVREYARKGQIYEPIIEEFKTKIAVDQGLIDEEVKSILKEAKDKIIELENKNDELFGELLNLREESEKNAIKAHLLEKCEDLTLEQKEFMKRVLGDASSIEEIDEKFDIVLEQAGKDALGPSPLEGKDLSGKVSPGSKEDASKKKGEGFKTAKGTKKEKAKKATGSEGDEETVGEKKLSPEQQVKEGARGKGMVVEEDEDNEKELEPIQEEYKRLVFKRVD